MPNYLSSPFTVTEYGFSDISLLPFFIRSPVGPDPVGLPEKRNGGKQRVGLFRRVPAAQTGIAFENHLQETWFNNYYNYGYFYNGGVAVGDLSNDGLPDLFFVGNQVPDKLFLNKGKVRVEDITKRLVSLAMISGIRE